MIWNTIPDDERLRLWKSLRNDIAPIPLYDKLAEVAKFCSQIPFGSRTVDYYTPADWPTPWEILYHGMFCTSSISILMAYSVILASPEVKVELYLVEDDEDIYLLPVFEDHFVLNYELGKVSTYPELEGEFKVLKKYTREEIKNIA